MTSFSKPMARVGATRPTRLGLVGVVNFSGLWLGLGLRYG